MLVAGIVAGVYSPWAQDSIRTKLVERINQEPGMEANIDKLRIRFPLNVELQGLMLKQDGDTLIAASEVKAEVALLPLFKGEVDVKNAFLEKARYQMGNADSLMMMVIKADTISIKPALVKLSPIDIDIKDGRISHGCISMVSRLDTMPKPAAAPDTTAEMTIRVRNMALDDFTFKMSMMPTIDSLGTSVSRGVVADAVIDLKKQTVNIGGFTGTGLNAAYIAPSAEQIAALPPIPEAPVDTTALPWTIEIDSIHFTHSKGLYTTHGLQPQPGLDFAYIQADSMDISVKNFYDQGSIITLPITLSATERCGVMLWADGTFAMDEQAMYFRNFRVRTPNATNLYADGMMGAGDMTTDPNLPLRLEANGGVSNSDLRLMFPAFLPYLTLLPADSPIALDAKVAGTAGDLNIYKADVGINHCVNLKANGRLLGMFAKSGPSGHLAFDGSIIDVTRIVNDFAKGTGLTVPPMTIDGYADISGPNVKANLNAITLGGRLALDANYDQNSEGYAIDLTTDRFPVNAFMRDLGVGLVTADVQAHGNGFDFFSAKTNLDANVDIKEVQYNGYDYRDLSCIATVHDGEAKISADIDNADVSAAIRAEGNLTGDTYDWTATVNSDHADLKALRFFDTQADVSVNLNAQATLTPKTGAITANLVLDDLTFADSLATYDISNVSAHFATCDSLTTLSLVNRDLTANLFSPSSLDSIMARVDKLSGVIDYQMKEFRVNPDSLQRAMPQFSLTLNAGDDNLINDILRPSRMQIEHANMIAQNDSAINLNARILGFETGDMLLDSIAVDIIQNGEKMQLIGKVDNEPGTLDDFAHIRLDCLLNQNKVALRAEQQNIKQVVGFDIGAMASISPDSTVTARIFPLNPVVGYKNWTVNFDNYIKYALPTNKVTANLRMRSDKSSIALYTEAPVDSTDTAAEVNDIVLNISDIQLSDWIVINPFAPPISGNLSADMRVQWDGGDVINGNGTVSLDDLMYNRERVGTFASDLSVYTNTSGLIRAKADLMVDGKKSMTLAGYLNDSTATSPFNLDFSVIHFPLTVANPFLPEGVARLSGTLNGTMDVSGDSKQPIINGSINFSDAAMRLYMTNTSYAFSDVEIPVVNNLVSFKDFSISGTNENPLYVNGTVDIADMAKPKIDLALNAKNMMVVNSNKAAKGAEIYGKGYLDIAATAKGDLEFLAVDANVTVLSGTNITYQMTDAAQTLQAPTETDMVKFVNFTDSAAVAAADSLTNSSMLLLLDATLNINSGSTVTVNLSATNARDKVTVQPQGSVNFQMSPVSDGRLTGRIVINSGMARYTLPVVGAEKEFTFVPGSYVAFNGDMLNPVLNIHADDVVKANVTQDGQNSRLVNFDISVNITGTLSAMDVGFDLSTNDDVTVANELQSMSAEQRANQAMNMLLYNVYTGPGTKGNANLSANPLFSFLESQVNNWAAQNIKGVDLTFGIDQYNQTINGSTSSTMSYSYQVSKSLFNDRFKIVIGGNYSTDADADDNLSQNLFNDISFEYYLNKQQTMLVKLFRHTGYESILEGEITKTGVGFVYKRKLNNLVQILPRFMRPKKYKDINV